MQQILEHLPTSLKPGCCLLFNSHHGSYILGFRGWQGHQMGWCEPAKQPVVMASHSGSNAASQCTEEARFVCLQLKWLASAIDMSGEKREVERCDSQWQG